MDLGTRTFEKGKGSKRSTWQIEQDGVRYFVAWSVNGGQSLGQTMTCDSVEDAARKVAQKIREKVRAGFVEVVASRAPAVKRQPKLKGVLDAYAAHAKKFEWEVQQVKGLERSYHVFGGLGFSEYLLIGPTESVALWFAVKEGTADTQQVRRFLAFLEQRHAEVFAASVAWKARLPKPIGGFDHALVLAPEIAQVHKEGLTLRQQFQAFPIYDCEFRGDETVSQAEARTDGRGSIPCSRWNRKPHPVLDMRLQAANAKKPAKMLIYDPSTNDFEGFVSRLKSLPAGSFLELKNYRGSLARVVRGGALTLALGDAPPEALGQRAIVDKLRNFIVDEG